MMRNPINDLEIRIMDSYKLICEYENQRRDTDDPRDRSRYKREIDGQWGLIEEQLGKYRTACKNMGHSVPEEVKQIAAHFPQFLVEDFQQAYGTLQSVVPESTGALQQVVRVLRGLGQLHEHLNEWKEMHNLAQECLTALMPLKSEIESIIEFSESLRRRTSCRRYWSPCRTQLHRLESFAMEIKYIDEPFYREKQGIRGPSWMIAIAVSRDNLQLFLKEDDSPIAELHEEILNLWDACYDALYRADKRFRDTVGELYVFSNAIIRSMDDERTR